MKKRLLSLLLVVCMALSMLPATAYAAVSDLLPNSRGQNQEILDQLSALTEGNSAQAYALLEQLGLLDENGQLKTDYTIDLDGETYTLDEMMALLEDPSTDLSQVGYVDGTPIALGDLKTIIQIEQELQRIQATYFSGQTFSGASLDSLNSLMDQLQTQGIALQSVTPRVADGQPVDFLSNKVVDVSDLREIPLEVGYNHAYSGYFYLYKNTQSGETVSVDVALDGGTLGDYLERVEVTVVSSDGNFSVKLTKDNPTATLTCRTDATEAGSYANKVRMQVTVVTTQYGAVESGVYGNLAGALHFSNPTGGLVFQNGSDYTDYHTILLTRIVDGPETVWDEETGAVSKEMTISNDGTPNGDEWAQARFYFLDTDGARVRQMDALRQLLQNSLQDASGDPVAINEVNAVKFQVSGKLVQTTDTGLGFGKVPYFPGGPDASKDRWYLPANSSDTSKDYTVRLSKGEMTLEWEDWPGASEMGNNVPAAFRFQGWSTKGDAIPYGLFFEDPFSHYSPSAYPHSGTATVQNCRVELLNDNTVPVLHSVTAPEGTYYPGQRIPVTLRFSELVKVADGTTITVNGKEFTADQLGMNTVGNDLVLWYPVQSVDSTDLTVSFGSGSGSGVTDFFGNAVEISGKTVEGVSIESIRMRSGVKGFSASYENDQLIFALDADMTEQYKTLYTNYDTSGSKEAPFRVQIYEKSSYGTYGTPKESVQVYMPASDGQPFSIASYSVPLQTKAQTYYAYIQANEGTRDAPQWVDVPWSFQLININAQNSVHTVTVNPESNPENYTLSLSETYRPTLTATLTGTSGGAPTYISGTWSSSDPAIAAVTTNEDYSGAVTLTGSKVGQVQFTFKADNGTPEDPSDDKTGVSQTYTVTAGDSLALVIPSNASTIVTRQNEPVTLLWSSNAKLLAPDAKFEYEIDLFTGYYQTLEELDEKAPQDRYSGTASQDSNSHQIAGGFFTALSEGDTPAYTVRISMPHPNGGGTRLYALAWVVVRQQPVQAEILTPETIYSLDQTYFGPVEKLRFDYKLVSFYPKRQKAHVQITRIAEDDTSTVVVEDEITFSDPGYDESTMITVPNGSYQFDIAPVADGNLRDTYQIVLTVTDKTGQVSRETATTDSLFLYVYNADALQLVDGDGNKIEGNLVVSNEDLVKDLPTDTQSILSLREQLRLQGKISINYEEYNWDSFQDTIQWNSYDPRGEGEPQVILNYKQGGLYEDIRNFSYTNYLPETVLMMTPKFPADNPYQASGRISATHSPTGMVRVVDVYFNSLRNGLYLFQVTPAVKTKVTLQAATYQETVETNDQGVLAVYWPYAITEDISFRSEYEGEVYLGTIPKESLRSGEGDATTLELYPLNNVILRPAGKAELTLLQPDGSPLANASVTIRGGVYKNGGYCQSAQMGPGADSLDAGSVGQTYTTDETGKLTIYYDSTQFWSSEKGETAQNQPTSLDRIEYVLEISGIAGDRYYPLFRTVEGSMSLDQRMRTAQDVILLEEVAEGEAGQPFVAEQTVSYAKTPGGASETGKVDVRKSTGMVGPNSTFQEATLSTTMYLWGESMEGAEHYVLELADQGGYIPEGQTYSVTQYPFSSIPVVKNTMTLNEKTMTTSGWIPDGADSALKTRLSNNGTLIHERTLPFRVIDLTRVPQVTEAEHVTGMLVEMKASSSLTDVNFGQVSGDSIVQLLAGNIDELAGPVDGSLFKMIITPSEDPTVFNALIWTGYDTLGLDEGDYSEDGVALSASFLSQEMGVGVPGTGQLAAMANGTYNPAQTYRNNRAQGNFGDLDVNLQLTGCYEAQIRYNRESKEWEIFPLGGGFTAGVGVGYTFNVNAFVGPVPVTASFGVGGALQLDFKAAARYSQQKDTSGNDLTWSDPSATAVNDYLTTLRINAYASAFGGVGFDYSVVALKFGVFGQLDLDSQNQFLSRTYLADQSKQQLNGQQLGISGQAGIKFVAKLGLLEYEAVLVAGGAGISKNFGDWNEIEGYWGSATSGLSQQAEGSGLYLASSSTTLMSRSYLGAYARTWGQPQDRMDLLSLDGQNGLSNLQTNANPASYPDLSDDGQVLVYVSDNESGSVYDSRAHYSTLSGEGYTASVQLPDPAGFSGYGDDAAVVAGTSDFAAAAWVRMSTDLPGKDEGDPVTEAEQTLLLNGSEIVVSVYDGSAWTSTRLTENATPDLAPAVASNGSGDAIVFWRSVYTSSLENTLDFGPQDYIMFSRYDSSTKTWSDPQLLYNGATGSVKALQAAMLPDGTAMAVYTLDRSGSGDTTQYEVGYGLVDQTGKAGTPINATRDTCLDENPQVVAANFGAGDDRFVMAWHTVHDGVGNICLLAVNKDGVPSNSFPSSFAAMTRSGAVSIDGAFRLASLNPANYSLDDLTVVWSETVSSAESGLVDHSILKASTLCADGEGGYCLSAPQELAELGSRTLADHFDAYASGENEIKAVIQATWYDDGNTQEIEGVTVPGEETKLYTATSNFAPYGVEVEEINVDYGELVPNLRVPIQFTIRNTGMNPLKDLTVSLSSGASATHAGTLLPNESATLTIYHNVGDVVENVSYTMTAGDALHESGAVYLDYPDIGISRMEVQKEEAGKRTIALTLYNASGAILTGKGRTVKLALYLDDIHTQAANVTCAPQNGVQLSGNILTISGDKALKRIDEGSLTVELTFDLGSYVTGQLKKQEVPESGVGLYAEAWAEGRIGSQSEIVRLPEYNGTDNQAQVLMTGALSRTGEQVTLSVEQGTDGSGNTTADVILKNNGLQTAKVEKLLAALFGADDDLLELKEVNLSDVTLAGETRHTIPVAFSRSGSRVAVYPASSQDTLIFDGLPVRMSSFTYNEETSTYEYALTDVTVPGSLVTAYAAGGGDVTINGTVLTSGGSRWVDFNAMTNEVKVVMGGKTYVLTVQMDPSMGTDADYPDILRDPKDASYELNAAAEALVVEAESTDGGALSYQWCISQNPFIDQGGPIVSRASVLAAPSDSDDTWFLDDPAFAEFSQYLGGVTPIPGANQSAYTPPTDAAGTTHYLCIVTNTNPGALGEKRVWTASYSAAVSVYDPSGTPAQPPVITVQPQDATYTVGQPAAELTVEASVTDGGTLSYQWYGEMPGVTDGPVMIPDATESSFDPTMTEVSTAHYYCVVTNTNPSASGAKTATATSRTAVVTYTDGTAPVDAQTPVITGQPESGSYTVGDAAEALTVSASVTDGGTLSYQWYSNTANSTEGGTEIMDATGASYTPATDAAGATYYYCVVTNTNDAATGSKTAAATSATAKITVEDKSSGSGGGTSYYKITVEPSEHGTVKSNRRTASRGSTVTLTVTPEEGYQLDRLTVTGNGGAQRTLTEKGNGVYTFVMPGSAVRVEAVFVSTIEEPDTPLGDLPFVDVPDGAWYEDAVSDVYEKDIMLGISEDRFGPELTTTRAMIVTILYRMEGAPAVTGASVFPDVPADTWYTDAVIWGASNGIVEGYGNGTFGPEDNITREQMATIFHRYAKYKGYDVTGSQDLTGYTDAGQVGSWALPAMEWAVDSGLLTGTSDTTLAPAAFATRAQVATVFMRFAKATER